jgi:hypothetical protein
MMIVSFGGGTNSTALLIGMKERGIRPDYITFADTGGEKPHTYLHNDIMQKWCYRIGFPKIVTVEHRTNGETLEAECLRRGALPSIAYGFKTCSQKFKLRPQEKYFKTLESAKFVWDNGEKITRAIGFDADEPHRAKEYDDPKYQNWYPLIEWDWGRDECVEAIKREGLPLPGKSSCYFCPSSKPTEIKWLAARHPDLMDRAIAMERNADLHTVKGLGRNYRWEDVLATDDMFADNFIELACGCYDG